MRPRLFLGGKLEGDDEVASIRLAMELILDGVKSRIFARVMLAFVLESLVARLKALLVEKTDGKR